MKLTPHQLRQIAVLTLLDPRTIARALQGGGSAATRATIQRALRRLHIEHADLVGPQVQAHAKPFA